MRKIAIAVALLAAIAPAAAPARNGSAVRVRIICYEHGQGVGRFAELCNGSFYWNGCPTGDSSYEQ